MILFDSDKKSKDDASPNEANLKNLGLNEESIYINTKREIENYIPYSYFTDKYPYLKISYGDWDDVKK